MPGRNIAFPYRRIPDGLVQCTDWTWQTQGTEEMVQSTAIDGWDYDSELTISRAMKLDVSACLSATGLGNTGSAITLTVLLETGPSGYRWIGYQSQILNSGEWSEDIQIEVYSGNLAGALKVYTDITLVSPCKSSDRLAATRPGSRLWGDTHQLDLEGSRARFPMEIIDFRRTLPTLRAPSANWYLKWQPDHLEGSFVGNVVLYLNSGNPELIERVKSSDPVTLGWIRSDIIRQLCSQVVENEEYAVNADSYADDSIGGIVRSWLHHCFQDMTLETARALYYQDRARFEARLLSAFGGDDG